MDSQEHRLQALASEFGVDLLSPEFASRLDKEDPLSHARELFHVPQKQDVRPDGARGHKSGRFFWLFKILNDLGQAIYLTGNSLGLQPKSLESTLLDELNSWKKWGVQGHFRGDNPWVSVDEVTNSLIFPCFPFFISF